MDSDQGLSGGVCIGCIGDPVLRAEISEEGKEIGCDYCGAAAVGWSLRDLADRVDDVYRENYEPGRQMPVVYAESDNVGFEMEGDQPSQIIGEMLRCDDEIASDVASLLSDDESYAVAKDGETAYYDSTSAYVGTEIHSFEHDETWLLFCEIVKHESRFFSEKVIRFLGELLGRLHELRTFGDTPLISLVGPGEGASDIRIFRARRATTTEARLEIVRHPEVELGAPPPELTPAGRMNPAGIPVFYGSLDAETAVSELRLSVGDVAITAEFEFDRTARVLDLTALRRVYEELSLFDTAFDYKAGRIEFLRNFERQISRPILPQDELLEYIPTQALTEYFANYYAVELDGVMFRSAQSGNSREEDDNFGEREISKTSKNIVLFNKSSRVRVESEMQPENGSVYSEYEEDWGEYGLSIWRIQSGDFGTVRNLGFGSIGGLDRTRDDLREPMLRLVEKSLTAHRIESIFYKCDPRPISFEDEPERFDSKDF